MLQLPSSLSFVFSRSIINLRMSDIHARNERRRLAQRRVVILFYFLKNKCDAPATSCRLFHFILLFQI
jgi:hypothetical protein